MLARAADLYRRTRKPTDNLWNRFVARPVAALFMVPLVGSRITPNQITLATLAVFAVSAAMLVALPGHAGLVAAVVVLEFSYVLDCIDGQLARLRGTSSPVGAHLDFVTDELKAFMLVAAAGLRLWLADDRVAWLVEALAALVAVASAISLTTFVRRAEYVAATGTRPPPAVGDYGAGFASQTEGGPAETGGPPAPRSAVRRAIGLGESLGRFVIHYPSYLVFVAAADRLDLFLHAYLAVNAAHAARTLLGVARALGRSAP